MNTLQTLINIALNKPAYRERALHQLRRNADKFHAMEVEAEYEAFMAEVGIAKRIQRYKLNGWQEDYFFDVFEVIADIHYAKKNGVLA